MHAPAPRLLTPLLAVMLLPLAGCTAGERPGTDVSPAAAGQGSAGAAVQDGGGDAQDALASLQGTAWRLVAGLAGVDLAEVDITLQFEPDLSAISGSGGCNQYRAELQRSDGGGVAIGPALATKRGCPGPRGRAEPMYFDALSTIERFDQQGDRLLAQRSAGPPLEFERASAPH